MTDTTPTDTTRTAADPDPDRMREDMIIVLRERGFVHRPEVADALRRVPRHRFVPEATVRDAYDPWRAVITHRFGDGTSRSCASAPHVVAMMLDRLHVRPGNRVLEIGAGTGYNAALLDALTGTTGEVTTIDIARDVVAAALHNLADTGRDHVRVLAGDGALGVPEHAPYDRLIATVAPWDIPTAWWDQLAPGGRMVVPLRWRGQTRSLALTHRRGPGGARLVADAIDLCGFVPLTGHDDGDRSAPISAPLDIPGTGHDPGTGPCPVRLHWDRDQEIDPDALFGALDHPAEPVWSGVSVAGNEPYDGIWLQMTAIDPRVCRFNAPTGTPPAVCAPISAWQAPAIVEGSSLAYLTSRSLGRDAATTWWELGSAGHGPDGAELARQFCGHIRRWDTDRAHRPALTLYPATTPARDLPATRIDKTDTRLVLTMPTSRHDDAPR